MATAQMQGRVKLPELLKGHNILIGREQEFGRLMVAVNTQGEARRGAALGEKNSVPRCVSRCLPATGVAHCRLDVDQEGNITLSNLKENNVTAVNGMGIQSKRVNPSDRITLGAQGMELPLNEVLEAASRVLTQSVPQRPMQPAGAPVPPQQQSKEAHIGHLESIWEDYHDALLKLKKRQRSNAQLTRLPIIFSMLGGVLAAVFNGNESMQYILIALSVTALLVGVGGFILSTNDKSIEKTEALNEQLQDDYVCPACKSFLGAQPFRLLSRRPKCPYCGAKFIK